MPENAHQGTTAGGAAGAGVAVVIVNYRTADLALDCLASIAAERAMLPDLRVVLVDGGSDDGSAETLRAGVAEQGLGDWVTLLPLAVNGGFGYANNQAILLLAQIGPLPRHIALINPDARVRPGALKLLADFLDAHPQAGAVGAQLEHEDGTPQGSAFSFPTIRSEFARGAQTGLIDRLLQSRPAITGDAPCRVDWVTGAAVMLRTAALAETGLFDDGFFLYFEETELMMRLTRAGWEIWHAPVARVVHLAGKATQLRDPVTGGMLRKRLPRYWHDARRRYFMRTGGLTATVAAASAWLAGDIVWKLLCVMRQRPNNNPPRQASDMLVYGLFPRRADRQADPPGFATPHGLPPAWRQADGASGASASGFRKRSLISPTSSPNQG